MSSCEHDSRGGFPSKSRKEDDLVKFEVEILSWMMHWDTIKIQNGHCIVILSVLLDYLEIQAGSKSIIWLIGYAIRFEIKVQVINFQKKKKVINNV